MPNHFTLIYFCRFCRDNSGRGSIYYVTVVTVIFSRVTTATTARPYSTNQILDCGAADVETQASFCQEACTMTAASRTSQIGIFNENNSDICRLCTPRTCVFNTSTAPTDSRSRLSESYFILSKVILISADKFNSVFHRFHRTTR